jgi:uncharacterized protein (TIGR03083 family)
VSTRELLGANDTRFHALAGGFSAEEWSQQSLCDAWSNHDVLAHLVIGYRAGPGVVASEMLRHGGSFNRANAALARALTASRSPDELLDEFERLIDHPRGLGRVFPPRLLLGDHITHELDILFALDREPAIPVNALVAVLNTQVAVPNPFVPAFRNSRGLRLAVTDADWTHGERGPLVEGRAAELVSALGNRPRVLARLRGDGVDVLASRVENRGATLLVGSGGTVVGGRYHPGRTRQPAGDQQPPPARDTGTRSRAPNRARTQLKGRATVTPATANNGRLHE